MHVSTLNQAANANEGIQGVPCSRPNIKYVNKKGIASICSIFSQHMMNDEHVSGQTRFWTILVWSKEPFINYVRATLAIDCKQQIMNLSSF